MTVVSVKMGTSFRWIGRYPSGRWREALHVWEEIFVSGTDRAVMANMGAYLAFDLNVTLSGANLLRVGRVHGRRFSFVAYRHPVKGIIGIWGDGPSGDELHVVHELGRRAGAHLLNETTHGPSWLS